jgi:hypothetical protein
MPQKFVAIQSTSYKVLTQHMVLRIRCIDGDEGQHMDVSGWMLVTKLDGWNGDGCWTKRGRTLDGRRMADRMVTDIE